MADALQLLILALPPSLLVVALAAPVVIGARGGGFARALNWGWGLFLVALLIADVLPVTLASLGAAGFAATIAPAQSGLVGAALTGWIPACIGFPLGRLIRRLRHRHRAPGPAALS